LAQVLPWLEVVQRLRVRRGDPLPRAALNTRKMHPPSPAHRSRCSADVETWGVYHLHDESADRRLRAAATAPTSRFVAPSRAYSPQCCAPRPTGADCWRASVWVHKLTRRYVRLAKTVSRKYLAPARPPSRWITEDGATPGAHKVRDAGPEFSPRPLLAGARQQDGPPDRQEPHPYGLRGTKNTRQHRLPVPLWNE
jgi:hypothetical protein